MSIYIGRFKPPFKSYTMPIFLIANGIYNLLTKKFAVVTLYSYLPALLDQTISMACELVRIVNATVTIVLFQWTENRLYIQKRTAYIFFLLLHFLSWRKELTMLLTINNKNRPYLLFHLDLSFGTPPVVATLLIGAEKWKKNKMHKQLI